MANRECNLTKRIRLADGSTRFCAVVLSNNGRIKPDWVIVDGREERHSEGNYYLDWYEGNKRIRLSVGKNAQDAAARRLKKEAELNARNHGVAVVPEHNNGRRSLSAAITEYLADVKLTKKERTHAAYSTALQYFQESCHKLDLEDIGRRDLLAFAAFLRDEKDQAPRSCANKFQFVVSFLKAYGIRGLAKKEDWPKYVEEEPEIYEQEELDALFAACTPEERVRYEFFLMTGMRDQEVMHTYWSDINFKACTVRVSHKPDRGWTPKAYKEREIPVPDKLMESLKAWKRADKNCNLVFPTAGCQPSTHFLEFLKDIAKRASLNPKNFWLHKFRATFATWHLWKGVDLRTVQDWMGHTDIESTMRYLKPNRNKAVREKVNETFDGRS
jgi:integrase/recombinase XerD